MTTRTRTLIQHIASTIEARQNCQKAGNDEWFQRHTESLTALEQFLPSGGGIDAGTTIDISASEPQKIKLLTSYHHMNANGFYDGWTDHTVIVQPAFEGLYIRITGRDRNHIKEYLHQTFDHVLNTLITQDETGYQLASNVEN